MAEEKDLLETILERPLLVSSEHDVAICGIVSRGRSINLSGYVKSESKPSMLHYVEMSYLPSGKQLLFGNCSCEAYRYYGGPCKHMLKLRNVYVKNEYKLFPASVARSVTKTG